MTEIDAVRRIHNRSGRLLKLFDLDAPVVIVAKERDLVRKAINLWLDSLDELLADGMHDA